MLLLDTVVVMLERDRSPGASEFPPCPPTQCRRYQLHHPRRDNEIEVQREAGSPDTSTYDLESRGPWCLEFMTHHEHVGPSPLGFHWNEQQVGLGSIILCLYSLQLYALRAHLQRVFSFLLLSLLFILLLFVLEIFPKETRGWPYVPHNFTSLP